MPRAFKSILSVLPMLFGIQATATAQDTLRRHEVMIHRFETFHNDYNIGRSTARVSNAGDVNRDGYEDVAVAVGGTRGYVRIYSGRQGSVLYARKGGASSISGAGDVNLDGYADYVVGRSRDSTLSSGAALVYSGKDGRVLYDLHGLSMSDGFGHSVGNAGDINGDGYSDIIVGAPEITYGRSGYALVFSGRDGSVLQTLRGDRDGKRFGHSVSGAGDVDNDGFDDVVVGASSHRSLQPHSYVRVVSGKDGRVLYTLTGDAEEERFGVSVSAAGDVNDDGYDDIIVGAPGASRGYARVISGSDGSTIFTFYGDAESDGFGTNVGTVRNLDGDGHIDLIVEAGGIVSSYARLFSGRTGTVLSTVAGYRGGGVGGIGDVNDDGISDFIVGANSFVGVFSGVLRGNITVQEATNWGDRLDDAARSGDVGLLISVLERGLSVDYFSADTGNSILHAAAINDEVEVVRALLDRGANINFRSSSRSTSLMTAARYGYVEIAEVLLRHGADHSIKDDFDRTALMYAVDEDRIDIAKMLLDAGADATARSDFYRKTVLEFAKSPEMIDLLRGVGAG